MSGNDDWVIHQHYENQKFENLGKNIIKDTTEKLKGVEITPVDKEHLFYVVSGLEREFLLMFRDNPEKLQEILSIFSTLKLMSLNNGQN